MTEEYPKARKRTHMSLSYLQCCHAPDETSHVPRAVSQLLAIHLAGQGFVVFQDSHQADSSCRASEHQQSFHWNLDRVSGSLRQKMWNDWDLCINMQEMVPGDARWSPSKPQSHPECWFADKGTCCSFDPKTAKWDAICQYHLQCCHVHSDISSFLSLFSFLLPPCFCCRPY